MALNLKFKGYILEKIIIFLMNCMELYHNLQITVKEKIVIFQTQSFSKSEKFRLKGFPKGKATLFSYVTIIYPR